MLLVLFLDFITFSLLSYALTNLFVHVPQSYFPILPILNSLPCACIFVSTGHWQQFRKTLFWTGDQCAATWRNGLNLTHHALPFSLTLYVCVCDVCHSTRIARQETLVQVVALARPVEQVSLPLART